MGQITIDFDAIRDMYNQQVIALDCQKKFKRVYVQLKALDQKIQSIVDSENFEDIPLSIKAALNKNWQEIKNYLAAVEADPDIMEMIDYN